MKTKECPNCKKELPVTEKYFYKHKRNTDGFQSRCIECQKEYFKQRPSRAKSIKRDIPPPAPVINHATFMLGKTYRIYIEREGKGTLDRIFKGQAIQITDRHITFKHFRHGYGESFLIWDLQRVNVKEV